MMQPYFPPPCPERPVFRLPLLGALFMYAIALQLIRFLPVELPVSIRFAVGLLPLQVLAPLAFLFLLRYETPGSSLRTVLCWNPSGQSLRQLAAPLFIQLGGTVAAVFFCNLVTSVLWSMLGLPFAPQRLLARFMQTSSVSLMVLIALSAVFLAPLSEEILFRGGLTPLLSRVFPQGGPLLSALLFALLHGQLITVPSLFLLALFLEKNVRRRGLRQSVLLHALFNAFNLLIAVLTRLPGDVSCSP